MRSRLFRGFRWGLALAVVVAGIVGGSGAWTVCHQETDAARSDPVVEVCSPPDISSLQVISGMIFILLLLWPELSEIGLPGGLMLKRRVERQEDEVRAHALRQQALEDRLDALQVQQQVALAGAAAQAHSHAGNVFVLAGAPQRALSELLEKQEQFEAIAESEGRSAFAIQRESSMRSPPTERAVLEAELIRLASQIEQWAIVAERYPSVGPVAAAMVGGVPLKASQLAALLEWREWFDNEIRIVRAMRNAIVESDQVGDDDLKAAVEIARTLTGTQEVSYQ